MCFGTVRANQFDSLWYDGNAEISTYSLLESRYGEIRTGKRIMVFVTEPMRLSSHVKPDDKLPDNEQIKVIKLNDLRKFTTGIYDYSVMTSVFAAVEKKQSFDLNATMKVAFSSQEWCGLVYDRYVRTPDKYEGVRYSYFDREGETTYSFPAASLESEENLWLRIRELNGAYLKEGESKTLHLIPARWIIRKTHVPTKTVEVVISKGKPEVRETALGKREVVEFKWTIDTASTVVYVESHYPHRIVEFRERDGSSGKLIASKREPYWEQNRTKFDYLRKELGL
jgi:hypothetical protein